MKHDLPPLDSSQGLRGRRPPFELQLAAAEELCVTKGAVSYQIRRLEERVGCTLFQRTVRQVALTDQGRELQRTTERVFADLEQTLERLRPRPRARDVSVAATTYVAARWLSPRIAQFSERHPEVSIALHHAVNADDFLLEDVDVAIRWGRCGEGVGRQRLLELPMPLFPACSRAVRARLGPRPTPEALIQVPLLCEDRRQDLWQEWADLVNVKLHNPRRVIADANVRVQAAIDGQGLVLADELMRSELASGALMAPFDVQLNGYGYVIMSAPNRPLGTAAVALRRWLCDL